LPNMDARTVLTIISGVRGVPHTGTGVFAGCSMAPRGMQPPPEGSSSADTHAHLPSNLCCPAQAWAP
jgi:hypothetical protein